VIAGEDHQSVVEEVFVAKGAGNLAYTPIDLLDGIAEVAEAGLAVKTG
jgi:hypothetical protein